MEMGKYLLYELIRLYLRSNVTLNLHRSIKNDEKEANATSRSVQRGSVLRDDSRSPHEKRSSSKSRDSLDHIVIKDRRKRPKSEDESREKSVESPKLPSSESKSSSVIKLKRSHTVGEVRIATVI